MNKRAREILSKLIEKKDYEGNITILTLMNDFQKSERTIRYDLSEINQFLTLKEFQPLKIKNNGSIEIQDDVDDVILLMKENDFYSFKLNKSEREEMIAYLLGISLEPITLQQLADLLFVSRSTIIHDVEGARKALAKYYLKIVPLPRGLVIDGRESERRILLSNLLKSQNVVRYHNQYHTDNYLKKDNIDILKQIISSAEMRNGLCLTDNSFLDLLKYIQIMIEEQQKGRFVEVDYSVKHTSMLSFAENILNCIKDVFIPNDSLQERYLLGDILYNLDYLKRNDADESLMQIQIVSKQFIDAITNDLKVDLSDDFQFYQNLSDHLQSSFKDIQSKEGEEMDLLRKIVRKNPTVVESIQKNSVYLENFVKRKLTEKEIAYITIHVCAAIERNRFHRPLLSVLLVCNSGIGTSQLLLSQLKKHFHFNVTDVIPSHALSTYDVKDVDLVISTVPIKDERCEIIVLHPFLSDEDCLLLGDKLESIKENRNNDIQDTNLDFLNLQTRIANTIDQAPLDKDEIYRRIINDIHDYFFPELQNREPDLSELLRNHVAVDVAANNWEEAIVKSAEVLKEEGNLNDIYIEAMIQSVKTNGPYIVLSPNFALPHESPSMGGKKLGMYLIRLKRPVEFGHESNDPVDFICCLATIDKHSHLKAMFNLMNILLNKDFLPSLRKSKTADEVYQIITEYEQML